MIQKSDLVQNRKPVTRVKWVLAIPGYVLLCVTCPGWRVGPWRWQMYLLEDLPLFLKWGSEDLPGVPQEVHAAALADLKFNLACFIIIIMIGWVNVRAGQ